MKTSATKSAGRGRPGAVPIAWRKEISCVLIPAPTIERRVRALARRIQLDYKGRDLVMVAILNGTVLFLADLVRNLTLPLHLDFIGVSSYREATVPGELKWTKTPTLDIRGRDVLLVDDILDTGATLFQVRRSLLLKKPRSLKTCVLLEKTARRSHPVKADYVGFDIPDAFVVGYGLDFAERYRNLPFIGIMRENKGAPENA